LGLLLLSKQRAGGQMRIAVVSTPIFGFGPTGLSGYGGLEHLAWQQAKGLAALGHQVALIAPATYVNNGVQQQTVCPGVTIIPNAPHAGAWDEKTAYGSCDEADKKLGYKGYWQHLAQMDCIIDNSWQKWSMQLKLEGR